MEMGQKNMSTKWFAELPRTIPASPCSCHDACSIPSVTLGRSEKKNQAEDTRSSVK